MPQAKKKTTKKSKNPSFKDVSHELNEILGLLKVNFENAWKSEEKAKVEKQLHSGINSLSKKLTSVLDSAKKGELDEVLLKQLHKGLKSTSSSLKKSAKKWSHKKKK